METYDPPKAFSRMPDVASVQTDASTCSTPPKPKYVPAKITSLISRLGLRFEPSVKSDLEAHAARVALLAEDLADADPNKLSAAIDQWVRDWPYMPKASDMRRIMAEIAKPKERAEYVDVVGIRNAELEAKGSHLRWVWNNPDDRGGGTRLTSIAKLENKLVDLP